jgi:hypothetical protein
MILAVINQVVWHANEELHTLREDKIGKAVAEKLTNYPHYLQAAVCDDKTEPHDVLRAILEDEVKVQFGSGMSDKIRKGFTFTYTWDQIEKSRVNWKPSRGGTIVSLLV